MNRKLEKAIDAVIRDEHRLQAALYKAAAHAVQGASGDDDLIPTWKIQELIKASDERLATLGEALRALSYEYEYGA